jgi:6-phosphogluconolactonase (cycloisomerase 2 family)
MTRTLTVALGMFSLCLLALAAMTAAQTVSLTPTTLAFTGQAVGTTSAAKTITLKNTSTTKTLTITSIAGVGEFGLTTTCGGTLAPNATCTLNVTSSPSTVGTVDGAITLTDNATIGTQVVSLTGKGLVPVTLAPGNLVFGSVVVGKTSTTKNVTLTNANVPLTMGTINTSGDFAVSTTTCTGTIAATKTCTITLTFSPTVTGTITGTLTVGDSASGSPQVLSLSGIGTGTVTNTVSFSPASLTFASQITGTTSASQPITLTNTGTSSLAISTVSASGDYGETDTCAGQSIPANGTCTINVSFAPTTTGTIKGAITVADAATTSPQEVALTGTGAPALSLSPPSLAFTGNVGITSAPQTATLTNNTASAVTISSVAVSGDYTQSNTCSGSVAANSNCTFSVAFSPLVNGTIDGAVSIATSASTIPQVINLAGTATTATSIARYAYALEYSAHTAGLVVGYSTDPSTGQLRALETVQLPGTNYGITVHPSNQFLYIPDGAEILAYTIGANGFLQPVTGSPFSLPGGSTLKFTPNGGFGYTNTGVEYSVNPTTGGLTQLGSATTGHLPYDVALSPSGGFLYIPNFQDGTISAFTINLTTGALTTVAGAPFPVGDIEPAAAVVSPNGKFLFVANFSSGNAGSISVFSINASTGALTAITGSPFTGSGPANGITVDPTGKFVYVAANGVDAYSVNQATGGLTAVTGSPYTTPAAPFGVTADPTGKFLYASIFGNLTTSQTAPDLITYSINPTTGVLTQISSQGVDGNQGEALAIATGTKAVTYTPKFAYVTNQIDKTISEFTINDATGALTALSGSRVFDTNGPTMVTATPSGAFVYTANGNNSVSEYSVNATTGALTRVSGSPITGLGSIAAMAVDPTSSYLLVVDGTNQLIDTYTISPTTGALTFLSSTSTPNKFSQAITFDPTGIVAEFVSSNSLDYYRATNGTLVALAGTPSAHPPLAIASDASSQYAFVADNNANTITSYAMPFLSLLSSATTGNTPSAVVAEPSGKYVYVANLSDGTISAYSLNNTTGALTQIGTAYAAAAGTNWLSVSSDGKYLYATNGGAGTVSIFTIKSDGSLTSSGTATTGTGPTSIATTQAIQ